MRHLIVLTLGAAGLLIAGGCPRPNTDSDAGALSEGVYSGTLSVNSVVFQNGAQVNQFALQRDLTEAIGPDGRPLLSTNEPVRVGDVLSLGEAGANVLVGRVEGIVESGNQLVIDLLVEGVIDGISVTGTGQVTYVGVSSQQIGFTLTLDYSGVDVNGMIIRQMETHTGTLTR